ncbi:MAG: hypothetical protein WA990_16475 [Rubrobacteraceae bacterium]
MSGNVKNLAALTLGCTFAAAVFGFGVEVFSWRGSYAGDLGQVQLIQLTRVMVYVALAVILVIRGGWWGTLAALLMVVGGTTAEWALFPFSADWAATVDPSGYEERFGNVQRPSYLRFATFDILGIGIVAGLTQGLRMMAYANPTGSRDE